MTGGLGFTPAPLSVSLIFVGVGFLPLLLALFRVWQVGRAVRDGDAKLAEIVEAEAGRARYRGTPWGEPLFRQGVPVAAKGTYRLGTGEPAGTTCNKAGPSPCAKGTESGLSASMDVTCSTLRDKAKHGVPAA